MPLSLEQRSQPDERSRMDQLGRGEQLILWSLRAIALGNAESPALRRAFEVALRSCAEEAFAALFLVVRLIGWGGRRRLRLQAPGCACVSDDETELLALFAEAQRTIEAADETALRRRLGELVETRLQACVLASLQTVACALEVNGYPLAPAMVAQAARTRLH